MPFHGGAWRVSATRSWALDRPRILAILNLTPDSFSDGGIYPTVADVVRRAEQCLNEGAEGLDVGGESTRPGAEPVEAAEQVRRVVPAIEAIRRHLGDGPAITIDTTRAEVARAALESGADAINDVSAGRDDVEMLPLAGARRCGVILMHRLAPARDDRYSTEYRRPPEYRGDGVVGEVAAFLRERAGAAQAAGVAHDAIVVDPGLGFGKSVEQNIELIRETARIAELGYPVLSALSRKSFVAAAAGLDGAAPARERARAGVGLSVAHLAAGAMIFRVHDVAMTAEALRAAWRVIGVRAAAGPVTR